MAATGALGAAILFVFAALWLAFQSDDILKRLIGSVLACAGAACAAQIAGAGALTWPLLLVAASIAALGAPIAKHLRDAYGGDAIAGVAAADEADE